MKCTEKDSHYTCTQDYKAVMPDELSVPKDACIEVIEKSLTGWWKAR